MASFYSLAKIFHFIETPLFKQFNAKNLVKKF